MIENNVKNAFKELNESFSKLDTRDKREELVNKINEMAEVINKIDPIDNLVDIKQSYDSEDEYLCYLNGIIYNLESKIGNIFKSIVE